ncbi:uncharacterized protein LOC111643643 [Copidosoma floridanum]|uniref:uncharacterized protein LOC111643643 n=1 Tax=Copidosoma floridanum TaxID=29053 RepID=UPI000C6F7EFB|nr:uncharacterized protein LOC111643643 [Copidosoma floridanum]
MLNVLNALTLPGDQTQPDLEVPEVDELSNSSAPSEHENEGANHHCDPAHTWLDVILVNSKNRVARVASFPSPYINGHDYIFIDYAISIPRELPQRRMRDFSKLDSKAFTASVATALGSQNLDTGDINEILTASTGAIRAALNVHAPITTRLLRRKPAPWFNAELQAKCHERDRVYTLARRTGCLYMLSRYRDLRPSETWSILRQYGMVGCDRSAPVSADKLDHVARHFSQMSSVHGACTDVDLESMITELPACAQRFTLYPCTESEVSEAFVACLESSQGRSLDGLALVYFKSMPSVILPSLTKLFNLSLASGIQLTDWKQSLIIPLPKVVNPQVPGDFRPVANIIHFAKVFDKVIEKRIADYLESNSSLSPLQSGFRRHRGTQSTLLKLMEDVRGGMEAGRVTILVLFDFRRAFDSINHTVL